MVSCIWKLPNERWEHVNIDVPILHIPNDIKTGEHIDLINFPLAHDLEIVFPEGQKLVTVEKERLYKWRRLFNIIKGGDGYSYEMYTSNVLYSEDGNYRFLRINNQLWVMTQSMGRFRTSENKEKL